uniref:Large ribosomal subunit protein uL15/eL18 domain-containing protein n=1 Tax=Vitis vinifera TaxID=29760 RepID=A5BN99_VITVI|nr:hypothetical protein VITISV_012514 [Vitis vinifera]
MGIGLVVDDKSKKTKCTAPKSDDIYLKLTVKLYHFLVRKTGSKFNVVTLKRFFMSKVNKLPLLLSRLVRFMDGKKGKIVVVIGSVTDDLRVYEVLYLKVTILRFTKRVREGIESPRLTHGLYSHYTPSTYSPYVVHMHPMDAMATTRSPTTHSWPLWPPHAHLRFTHSLPTTHSSPMAVMATTCSPTTHTDSSQIVEVYINDIVVKRRTSFEHLLHLEEAFGLMRKYDMKLNSLKCAFRVSARHFLRFMSNEQRLVCYVSKALIDTKTRYS